MSQIDFLKSCLVTSYIQLLSQKDKDKITIQEICQQAGVSRPTFYRHFYRKEDLLVWQMEGFLAEMDAELDRLGILDDQHDQIWSVVLNKIHQEADFFTLLHQQDLLHLMVSILDRHFRNVAIFDDLSEFHYAYLSQGVSGLISHWIKEGFKTSQDDLLALIKGM